jgi:hypothetical protein
VAMQYCEESLLSLSVKRMTTGRTEVRCVNSRRLSLAARGKMQRREMVEAPSSGGLCTSTGEGSVAAVGWHYSRLAGTKALEMIGAGGLTSRGAFARQHTCRIHAPPNSMLQPGEE